MRRSPDGFAGEFSVQIREHFFTSGINEQAVDLVQTVIAGGPLDRPSGGQCFTGLYDFFDHDPGGRREPAEALKILFGIAQSIGMIHAQAVDPPGL